MVIALSDFAPKSLITLSDFLEMMKRKAYFI